MRKLLSSTLRSSIGRRAVLLSGALAGTTAACQIQPPTETVVDDTPPVIAARRPPPLSGGTLLATRDGAFAVAADPERDRVVVVSLDDDEVRTVDLQAGDEPGRVVEDAAGRVHVATRASGALVTIDVASATILARRPLCEGPRGLLYEAGLDAVYVACADGQLVTLAADPEGAELGRGFVEADLRDVVKIAEQGVLVSTFRSAEVLAVDPTTYAVRARTRGAEAVSDLGTTHTAQVAYRTFGTSDGGAVMLHQLESTADVDVTIAPEEGTGAAYDGGDCSTRLVTPGLTYFDPVSGPLRLGSGSISSMSLSVDVAISQDGLTLALVDVMNKSVVTLNTNDPFGNSRCDRGDTGHMIDVGDGVTPIAVAFAGEDVLVQTREPSKLLVLRGERVVHTVALGGASRADTGFDLFYNLGEMRAQTSLACASCHAEGRDDGHVWIFSDTGPRRTQALAGTIEGTAPYHWGGDLDDLQAVMDLVLTERMAGPRESEERVSALQSWIEQVPPIRVAAHVSTEVVDRGQALYESEEVGCASCHGGLKLTNNENADVGRGDALQTPSLIGIGMRAPFMHDGCAATMIERFSAACGGGDEHGHTSQLDQDDLEALAAYVETL